jgi:hypothetical protein
MTGRLLNHPRARSFWGWPVQQHAGRNGLVLLCDTDSMG